MTCHIKHSHSNLTSISGVLMSNTMSCASTCSSRSEPSLSRSTTKGSAVVTALHSESERQGASTTVRRELGRQKVTVIVSHHISNPAAPRPSMSMGSSLCTSCTFSTALRHIHTHTHMPNSRQSPIECRKQGDHLPSRLPPSRSLTPLAYTCTARRPASTLAADSVGPSM